MEASFSIEEPSFGVQFKVLELSVGFNFTSQSAIQRIGHYLKYQKISFYELKFRSHAKETKLPLLLPEAYVTVRIGRVPNGKKSHTPLSNRKRVNNCRLTRKNPGI